MIRRFILVMAPAMCAGFLLLTIPLSHAQVLSSVSSNSAVQQLCGDSSAQSNNSLNLPLTILVDSTLNVRSGAGTTFPLAGSQTLIAGNEFKATNGVTGDNVNGNDLWWVSSLGNYVWSGGTQATGGAQSFSTKSSGLKPQTTASNPSITNVTQTPLGLIVSGSFDASGNTVSLNGQNVSVTYQSQNVLDVSLSTSPVPPFNVTVSDSQGTSPAFTVSAAPTLKSVQGYNPTTNKYETMSNVLNPGDTYVILYGSFASSGNLIVMNNTADLNITYQSATQINVSLAGVPAASSPFSIEVSNPGGVSASVRVVVNGASVNTQSMSVSIAAVLAQLRTASSLSAALTIAQNAGLTIAGGVTDEDGDVSYIVTTPNGTFVAAIGNYDASTAVGAPISDAYVYNNTADASSDEFLCKANVGSGTADVNTFPDGKVYGLADAANYSVSVNCVSGSNAAVSCSATQAASNAAAGVVTAAGGPPLVSDSSVATINVQWINSAIDNDSAVLAQSIPIVLADGMSVCNIDLSSPSLGAEYATQVAKGNTGFLQQVITHEMGHCMGLSHASTPNSVMYYDATAQPTNASFTADDKAVLSALRSNANIPVTCASAQLLGWACSNPMQVLSQNPATNVYSCQSCPAGEVPIAGVTGNVSCQICPAGNFYQEISSNSDGSLSIQNKCNSSCSTTGGSPGTLYNILGSNCVTSCGTNQVPSENGYQCECAPGMTYDVSSGECIQSQGLSSNNSPECTSGFLSPDGTCYSVSEAGTPTENICYELGNGTTQCSCTDGYEQQGNSCAPVSGGSLTGDSGGYV